MHGAAVIFRVIMLACLFGTALPLSAQNSVSYTVNLQRAAPQIQPSANAHPKQKVLNAIWNASQQTGVDYDYLLAKAHLESSLNPKAKARGSTAAGLFQFIEGTWLASLERYAAHVDGLPESVKSPKTRRSERLLWRHDAQIASVIAAAHALDNGKKLERVLGRKATRTELYLAHFLGSAGAGRFMSAWQRNPGMAAELLFPRPARANRAIFYASSGQPRSLNGVLRHFERKIGKALATLGRDDARKIESGSAKPLGTSATNSLLYGLASGKLRSHCATCNHIEMCYTTGMSTSTITQVKDLIDAGTFTKAGIARAAGLHANTLRDASEADWNPTADTLAKLQKFLDANDQTPVLVGAEEIIDEARNGRMYILVDDEDRENEGDLIIPAQMATPAAVNFMATHGRGLICLALDKARVDELGLDPMSRNNKESMQTAFTVSIEAKEGVTTGISAADRARTISVAIDASKGLDDIVTPGHVFPLMARDGGTLVRAGHTEAAVDISRLAGLNPSGVICEIMNEDGTMARLDDLIEFARKHDLKIGTIRDLIAYRMRNDHLVERVDERSFESDYGGQWRLITYRNTLSDNLAYVLQKGHITPDEPTLTRVHPISVFDDVLGAPGPRKRTLQRAMGAIGDKGAGVIVILTQRVGQGAKWTPDEEHRNIGIGSQILADLGVQEMTLLSNSRPDLVALEGFGISVTGHQPIPD